MGVARSLLAWLLALPILGWVALRYLASDSSVQVVALVAFTPYATAGAVGALLLVLLLRRWLAFAVAAVAAGALVLAVAPRVVGDGDPARGPELTVLSTNVRLGQASPEAIAALARSEGADVVAVQELTPEAAAALDAAGFAADYPNRVLRTSPGGAGIGLYSRVALSRERGRAGGTARGLVEVRGARAVEVLAVHPQSPRDAAAFEAWRRGLRALPRARRSGPPRILAGDFNATLDHAELRRLIASGYLDAADAVGAGLEATWPEGRRIPPPVTIDHVLADRRVGVSRVRVQSIPRSDHRAVVAHLTLPSS